MVTDGSPITVAIVPKGVHPFFEDCRIGAEEEATALGVDLRVAGAAAVDAAMQVKMIEDLITKQVNAIVISPNEPTSVDRRHQRRHEQGHPDDDLRLRLAR